MISLLGQCYGLVKNTQSDFANNSNCNWKTGDPNYELAVLPEDGVIIFLNSKIDTQKLQ
jgi:hypothetical protein